MISSLKGLACGASEILKISLNSFPVRAATVAGKLTYTSTVISSFENGVFAFQNLNLASTWFHCQCDKTKLPVFEIDLSNLLFACFELGRWETRGGVCDHAGKTRKVHNKQALVKTGITFFQFQLFVNVCLNTSLFTKFTQFLKWWPHMISSGR